MPQVDELMIEIYGMKMIMLELLADHMAKQAQPDDALRAFADRLHALLDTEVATNEAQAEFNEMKKFRLDDNIARAHHLMNRARPRG